MSELKATPGDWFIRKGDEWTKDIVTLQGYNTNEEPMYWNLASGNIQRDEADANLHLFHASRDLYDALENILTGNIIEASDKSQAQTALAKARGEY